MDNGALVKGVIRPAAMTLFGVLISDLKNIYILRQ